MWYDAGLDNKNGGTVTFVRKTLVRRFSDVPSFTSIIKGQVTSLTLSGVGHQLLQIINVHNDSLSNQQVSTVCSEIAKSLRRDHRVGPLSVTFVLGDFISIHLDARLVPWKGFQLKMPISVLRKVQKLFKRS